jgi:hypothetical protein
VRFKCLNPPTANNYLLSFRQGQYWPQPGPFRQVEDGLWEIDVFFGSSGDHALQIVTGDALGVVLFEYYRKVARSNEHRRDNLDGKIDRQLMSLLRHTHIGIQMAGLPKGIRLEASVTINVAEEPSKT